MLSAVYGEYGRYYSHYLATQQAAFNSQNLLAALNNVTQAYDNIQVVWQRALAEIDESVIRQMGLGLAMYHYIHGRLQPGLALFAAACAQLSGRVAGVLLAELQAWQALFLCEVGQYEEAIETAQSAIEQLSEDEGDQQHAVAIYCQGYAHWSVGEYDEGEAKLTQAAELAQSLGLIWVYAQSLSTIGNILLDQGDVTAAQQKYHAGLTAAQSVHQPRIEASLRINLGNSYWHIDDYGQARAEFEQALTLSQQFGMRQLESLAWNNIGLVDSARGEFGPALEAIRQALAIGREVGDRRGEGNALLNLVAVQIESEDLADAWEHVDDALAVCRAIGDKQGEGIALEHYGGLYLRCGSYERAAEYFDQAWEINTELGEQWGLATISVWRGLLALYREDAAAAYQQALHGLERAQELQDQSTEALAQMIVGHLFFADQQYEKAAEAYGQAAVIREEIGQSHLNIEFHPAWLLCRHYVGDCVAADEVNRVVERLLGDKLPGIYEVGRLFADVCQLLLLVDDERYEQLRHYAENYLQEMAAQLPREIQDDFWQVVHHRPFAN